MFLCFHTSLIVVAWEAGNGAALVVVPPIGGRANKDRHHFSSSSPRSLTQVCHQLKLTNVNYQNQKKNLSTM